MLLRHYDSLHYGLVLRLKLGELCLVLRSTHTTLGCCTPYVQAFCRLFLRYFTMLLQPQTMAVRPGYRPTPRFT